MGAERGVAETELRGLFARYRVGNLHGISEEEFRHELEARMQVVDAAMEGYSEEEMDRQRDLSIRFHWGHDHDFGTFKIDGKMRDRHVTLVQNFLELFPVTLEDIRGKAVFDVGCWTGGTTLLLAALAREVYAIEEVRKYAETAAFLARSFGLGAQVRVESRSLYECNDDTFHERFDVVHFPGVIYHLTDPLLALRILFNSLKVGGLILVESAGIDSPEPICRFDGSLIHTSGTRETLTRTGWNWFMPSALALERMMREAGFDAVETLWHAESRRVYGFGRKTAQAGMCKAGLSVRDIR